MIRISSKRHGQPDGAEPEKSEKPKAEDSHADFHQKEPPKEFVRSEGITSEGEVQCFWGTKHQEPSGSEASPGALLLLQARGCRWSKTD